MPEQLTPLQEQIMLTNGSAFLLGAAGTGKSTALQYRLRHLLNTGEPAYTILILVADRTQRDFFTQFVQQQAIAYSDLKLIHYPHLAQEMVTLFWPLVAREAGFDSGFRPPTYLGYDLAQLLMWRTITPLLESGSFADIRRRPQQIVSQLLDTLNRAALNNLDIFSATRRQIETWVGEPDHIRNLQQAQEAAVTFRQYCLDHNLLDLSLTIDTFNRHVLAHPEFSRYFSERYRHLLVDNVEEQTPAGQAFIAHLMNATVSTTIAYDAGGGYRRFLAADPLGSNRFKTLSTHFFAFEETFTTIPTVEQVGTTVEHFLNNRPIEQPLESESTPILAVIRTRYRREMVNALAERLAQMIHQDGVSPADIAIIVPYLDGALRYVLTEAFKLFGIPMNLVRRRATPREEPRVRAWLTWVALAHPNWGVFPTTFDVAEALTLSIGGLDPARATLLANHVYPANTLQLKPADEIPELIAARVGSEMIALYEQLRLWLEEQGGEHDLDHFLYNLFAELLSTRTFQPEPDIAGAGVCQWLVRTATRLADSAESLGFTSRAEIGHAFLTSVNQGLITSQPPEMGDPPDPNGVLISTIYGYLLRGEPVRYQVWLETGASGWWDIPRQPLSNAFVLAESWNEERSWTLTEEVNIRNELLSRVVRGLVARCREGIILATSDLDRRGQRQDGALWRAFESAEMLQTTNT